MIRGKYLKHGQQQVFFTTLVLVPVDREHDGLEEGINFGHGNQSAKVGNMPGLGLKEEQQISVLLSLVIIGKITLLHLIDVF